MHLGEFCIWDTSSGPNIKASIFSVWRSLPFVDCFDFKKRSMCCFRHGGYTDIPDPWSDTVVRFMLKVKKKYWNLSTARPEDYSEQARDCFWFCTVCSANDTLTVTIVRHWHESHQIKPRVYVWLHTSRDQWGIQLRTSELTAVEL